MSEEEKMPYLIENKERDTFTFYVKGTKPYLDLQQKIDKAIEYIQTQKLDFRNDDRVLFIFNKCLEILGEKE